MTFDHARHPAWHRYAVAALLVALAVGTRAGFLGMLGTRLTYATLYPAVILAALYGGFLPGLFATLLSALGATLLWIEPTGRLQIQHPADWLGMTVFLVSCTMIAWISEALRRAQQRAIEAETEARVAVERERAAEEIRSVSDRLQLAAAAAEIGVWSWIPGTADMIVSADWRRLLGIPPETHVTVDTWRQALHPDDRDRVTGELNAAVSRHGEFYVEYRAVWPDGTLHWLADRGRPSYGQDGRPANLAGACRDITGRKQAEMVREQESRKLLQLNRSLRALSRSDQMLLLATSETAYLEDICKIIVEECGHALVWVGFRENDEARTIRPAAYSGFEKGYLDTLQVTWADTERGRGPTGTAIRTGKLCSCRNMLTDPAFLPWREEAIRRGYASSVSLPLSAEGEAFGALTIYSKEPDAFSDEELKLLAELAGDFAYGITVLRLREAHTRAEQALRESEERLRLAYEAADSGAWEWDLRTNQNVWSKELWKVYGLEPHCCEPSYEAWLRVVHPDDRARAEQMVQEAARNGAELNVEFRVRDRDGAERWLMSRGRPLRDAGGQVVRFIGIAVDITRRKQSEEAVLRAYGQRRLALEAAELGAWDYRLDTGEVFWDERCRDMFGVPTGDRVGYDRAIAWIHPDDRAAVDLAVKQAIAGAGGGAYHQEFRVVWPDGSVHWVSSHGRAYFEGAGDRSRAVRFVGVNMEITERRLAEENLRQAQKLESIGLLAGGIAHDFNNLLVGVIGNASLAEDMLPRSSPVAEVLRGIVRAGERAALLTRQMLAYAGKGQFVLEAVDLSELVRETSGLIQVSISKKIAFHFALVSGMPAVEADPGQMQQVFMNLALNAAESIGSNSGVISVTTGEQTVTSAEIRSELSGWPIEPGRHVFLEVRDTGCGIDAAAKARIFDPFFTTKFQGRGLGLAAVAGIVRSHNGAVKLTTEPGTGSTFRVLFPAMPAAVAVSPSAAPRKDDLRGQGAILVVDDEQVVRDLAQRSLERRGYEVLLAADGPAAIDVIRSDGDRIRLVVLDLGLPGMTGEEVLPRLREFRPDLEVIVSSGYSEAEALRLFHGARLSGFIQKPYTAQDLARALKSALA
jgi:PAS domain S-box-containing protein